MKNIVYNFKNSENLVKLFEENAKQVAKEMKEEKTSTTQFRKFYEKVLELNDKASRIEEKEFNVKVKPFLVMLNSKVAYSETRKNCGKNFVTLMNESIKEVKSKEELQNFKYFLESIIGYMPKK